MAQVSHPQTPPADGATPPTLADQAPVIAALAMLVLARPDLPALYWCSNTGPNPDLGPDLLTIRTEHPSAWEAWREALGLELADDAAPALLVADGRLGSARVELICSVYELVGGAR